MFNIDKYLKRFSRNLNSLEFEKDKILEILKKHTNITLDKNDIEIKNYKIVVNTNMVGKNQIFIKKRSILDEINSNIETKVVDIK
jgi:hypothetical protein